MLCPRCQKENPAEARFCLFCGEKLVTICPRCGTALPPDARFCSACGAAADASSTEARQQEASAAFQQAAQKLMPRELADRLMASRGQVSSERRQVTILFCDIKGSTAMAGNLDPEDMLEVINGAFEFLIAPIFHHEGTLTQLLGDAILAFFGAPIAHEDDPERAIRAALDITAGARSYGEKLERERGLSGFTVRVGIHTGRVIVGEVGSDLRVAYTAVGETINLAARMEQHAPPNGILITHDTYRHVRGVFDVVPQEPLTVKGKAQPIQTYLVDRAKPRAFRTASRGVEGVETRTVGREPELQTLQNLFRDAIEDRTVRVVTIVGEAGVGKSRLLYEFSNWMELRPEEYYYFKGRAAAVAQAVPYYVIRDLLAQRFEILDSDPAPAALAKFRAGAAPILDPSRADVIGQLVGFDFAAAGSPAVQALLGSPNFATLGQAYFQQYVRGLAAQHPVVILLEDVQWADDPSLDLIAALVAALPRSPLLVVACGRPSLFDRRPNWGEGQRAYSRLDLKPLSPRASRELVDEILQRVPQVPASLQQMLVDGAEGNPYYAEELVRMLIDDGVIVTGADEWHVEVERLGQVRVPATLTGVLQARLDALPESEHAVLQRAAVVGRLFWDSAVQQLAADATEPIAVGPALGALRQRELVFRRERSAFADAQEYAFQHAILRDVTYESVLLRLRRKYHAEVAHWLEAHAGDRLNEYLGLIATHLELAGEGERAAQYWGRSGVEAFRLGALRDSRAALERALALLGPLRLDAPAPALAARARMLKQLGWTLGYLGEFEASSARTEECLVAARAAGDRGTEGVALCAQGELAKLAGQYDQARQYMEQALVLVEEAGDDNDRAEVQCSLSHLAWATGRYHEATERSRQGQALFERLGDRRGVAQSLNTQGIIAINHRDLALGGQLLNQALTVARELGDRVLCGTLLNNLGEVARFQGDLDTARACYEECGALAEETGDGGVRAVSAHNLGWVELACGTAAGADAHLLAGLRLYHALEHRAGQAGILGPLAALFVLRQDRARAAELLGLLFHHPATTSDSRLEAEPVLAQLRQEMPADELEAALARGAARDLDKVVRELLGEQEPGPKD